MNLVLKITHHNIQISINACVGSGNGTVKWLSLMAAQRYALCRTNDRLRSKENSSFISSIKKPKLLPKNVFTDDIPFLHPNCVINNRLKDGHTVYIELYDHLPLDEFGTPQYSPYAYIAFFVSDANRDLREVLSEQKKEEAKEFDQTRLREAEELRIASNRPKLQQMRIILMEHLRDEDLITTAISNEWASIINSGALDSFVSQEEQGELKTFITQNYEEMAHMFKYYSAVNSGGGTSTLEYIEFTKFLQETTIFQSLQSNVIIKLFGASPSNIHSEIIQWEFFVSCIKIAVYKYITLTKKNMAALKRRGHRATITQIHASVPTPPQALQMLFDKFLRPVIDRLPASTAVKKAFDSDDVLLLIHMNLDELSRVFCKYAETKFDVEDIEGSRDSGILTLQQFILFCSDYDFLGPTSLTSLIDDSSDSKSDRRTLVLKKEKAGGITERDEITLKDVRQVFSASQHDTAMNDVELQLIKGDSHKETMVFPEFIEAIVRLGFLKYGSVVVNESDGECHGNSSFECIRLALANLISRLCE